MVDGCRLPLTGKLHDPVGLPGLAAVGRERLFPTAGIRGVDVPDEAVENVPAFEHFLRIEFSARAIELADHWHIHSSRMAAGRPIDAPLARCGISRVIATGQWATVSILPAFFSNSGSVRSRFRRATAPIAREQPRDSCRPPNSGRSRTRQTHSRARAPATPGKCFRYFPSQN